MRKIFVVVLAWVVVWPLQGRAQMAPQDPLAQAENAFAIDLYGKLSQKPGNLFFSPYSIATALDMVFVGARGATADEIARTLHLSLLGRSESITELQLALLREAKSEQLFAFAAPNNFKFKTINALWGDEGYTFDPKFTFAINRSFDGDLKQVNFNDPESASAEINTWVSNETNDEILNLLAPDVLNAETRMVLTNVVYFKAVWATPFVESATSIAKFHVSSTQDVNVDMMNMTDKFSLTQANGIKVLNIPYNYNSASMFIILPKNSQGLAQVEMGLNVKNLNAWLQNSQFVPVILSLPKFRTDSQFRLKDVLMQLGISKSFDPNRANFTGITSKTKRSLYISAVVHKAFIEVDEKGTEAGAATAVSEEDLGFESSPPPPVRFNANHPFIYLIRSNLTGEILFMGRVDDPTQLGD